MGDSTSAEYVKDVMSKIKDPLEFIFRQTVQKEALDPPDKGK